MGDCGEGVNGTTCLCPPGWTGRDEFFWSSSCQVSMKALNACYAFVAVCAAILLLRQFYVAQRYFQGELDNAGDATGFFKAFHMFQLLFALSICLRLAFALISDYRFFQLGIFPSLLLAISSASFLSSLLMLPLAWLRTLGSGGVHSEYSTYSMDGDNFSEGASFQWTQDFSPAEADDGLACCGADGRIGGGGGCKFLANFVLHNVYLVVSTIWVANLVALFGPAFVEKGIVGPGQRLHYVPDFMTFYAVVLSLLTAVAAVLSITVRSQILYVIKLVKKAHLGRGIIMEEEVERQLRTVTAKLTRSQRVHLAIAAYVVLGVSLIGYEKWTQKHVFVVVTAFLVVAVFYGLYESFFSAERVERVREELGVGTVNRSTARSRKSKSRFAEALAANFIATGSARE